MAAPFALPDLADLFFSGQGTPYAEDVPCRQVPAYARTGGTQSTSPAPIYTHWVDFEVSPMVRDNTTLIYPRISLAAPGDRIVIIGNNRILTLQVLWVEDRFTNTPEAYQRAYCVRVSRVPL